MFLRVGFVDLVVGTKAPCSRPTVSRLIGDGLSASASRRLTFSVSVARPRTPHLSDGPHCPVTEPTNGRRVSHVMRYLVPAFAVTTSIESAPMRDVRETSVEIGAVAGRPAQHLARFSEPALSSHLLGAYDASTIRFELTGQVTPIPNPGARRPGRARSGRASGVASRGAKDGATGGGHRSSSVIPREVPGGCGGGEAEGGSAGMIEREDILGRSVARWWEGGTAARAPARDHLGGIPNGVVNEELTPAWFVGLTQAITAG